MSNTAILIPEIEIYEVLNIFVNFAIEDYKSKSDKTSTFLWHIFGKRAPLVDGGPARQMELGKFKFFDEAVNIIVDGGVEKKRKIEISVGYNMQRASVPTFHIVMPSESPKNAGIGDNEGYTEGIDDKSNRTYFRTVTQDASVQYTIIITSDNVNEVLVLYNFLKACFLGMKAQLELRGFQNTKSGGTDLNLSDDLMPTNIFHRSFTLLFDYDYTTVDPFGEKYGLTVSVNAKPDEKK